MYDRHRRGLKFRAVRHGDVQSSSDGSMSGRGVLDLGTKGRGLIRIGPNAKPKNEGACEKLLIVHKQRPRQQQGIVAMNKGWLRLPC
jgi:hypothetical protein